VRGIDAHDKRAVTEAGKLETGGGGDAGLAHASFAAKEQDAHVSIVEGTKARNSFNPLPDGAIWEL
jgi:hypothetical protein